VYKNVNLFGLDVSTSGQGEHEQDIRGFAAWKELGPIDTTFINLQWVAGIGFQEVVVRTNKVGGGIGEDITSTVNSVIDKAFSPRNNTPPPLAGSG
jgi:hypothetical protein